MRAQSKRKFQQTFPPGIHRDESSDEDHSTEECPAGAAAAMAQQSRTLRNSIIGLAIFFALVAGLLLSVPGLRAAGERISDAHVAWVAAGIGLEILSCAGYVVLFGLVFGMLSRRLISRLSLSELAVNSVVSVSGLGGDRARRLGATDQRRVGRADRQALSPHLCTDKRGERRRDGADRHPDVARSAPRFAQSAAHTAAGSGRAGHDRRDDRAGRVGAPRRRPPDTVAGAHVCRADCPERWRVRRAGADPRESRLAVAGAVGYWLFDVGALYACLLAYGPAPSFWVVAMAYLVGMLANSLPIPAGLIAVEGGLFAMLLLFGVRPARWCSRRWSPTARSRCGCRR